MHRHNLSLARSLTRARTHTHTRAAFHCMDEAMKAADRVLFLATDTPEIRDEARRRYGARALFQDVPVAHTGEQHG